MFLEAVHVQQEDTPYRQQIFPNQITSILPGIQNTDRDAIKSIILNCAIVVYLFFTRNSMA
jgi:hypothetical protein